MHCDTYTTASAQQSCICSSQDLNSHSKLNHTQNINEIKEFKNENNIIRIKKRKTYPSHFHSKMTKNTCTAFAMTTEWTELHTKSYIVHTDQLNITIHCSYRSTQHRTIHCSYRSTSNTWTPIQPRSCQAKLKATYLNHSNQINKWVNKSTHTEV